MADLDVRAVRAMVYLDRHARGKALSKRLSGLVGTPNRESLMAALIEADVMLSHKDFNPNERRDPHGRWTTGGSSGIHDTVSIGSPGKKSSLSKSEHADMTQAVQDALNRHPELVDGPLPIKSISYASAAIEPPPGVPGMEWRFFVRGSARLKLATGFTSKWKGTRVIVSDNEPLKLEAVKSVAPSSRTSYGAMTHEIGHCYFRAHGIVKSEAKDILGRYGLGPARLADISEYAASNADEALAELYSMTHTPGFKIDDADMAWRFEGIMAEVEKTSPARADLVGLVTDDPEILAEVKRAAAKNIEADDWVASTPLMNRYGVDFGENL